MTMSTYKWSILDRDEKKNTKAIEQWNTANLTSKGGFFLSWIIFSSSIINFYNEVNYIVAYDFLLARIECFDSLGIIWWHTSCLQYHKDYCLTSFLRTFKSRTISDTSVLEFNTAHSSIHDNTFKFSKIIHHRSGKFEIFEASIVYLSPWLACWSVLGRSRCHGNSSRYEASSKSWDMPWSG